MNKPNGHDPREPSERPPFWRHRYYYLALKIIVLVFAAAVALRILANWWAPT